MKLHANEHRNKSLTNIGQRNWNNRIAVALHGRFVAIAIDSTLTGAKTGVVTRPKILWISISIIPPGISDVVEFNGCKVTIVLYPI